MLILYSQPLTIILLFPACSITPPSRPGHVRDTSLTLMAQVTANLSSLLSLVKDGHHYKPLRETTDDWQPGVPFLNWPPPQDPVLPVLPPWKRRPQKQQQQFKVAEYGLLVPQSDVQIEENELRWHGNTSAEFTLIGAELHLLSHVHDDVQPLHDGNDEPRKLTHNY